MDVVPASSAGLPATITANVNRSGRALDPVVSPGSIAVTRVSGGASGTLDLELPRRRQDRELVPIRVRVHRSEVSANPRLSLEIQFAAGLFTILDQSLTPLPETTPGVVRVDVEAALRTSLRQGIELFIEARTVRQSPLVGSGPASAGMTFVFSDRHGTELARQVGVGPATSSSTGTFAGPAASPMRLIGDDGVPERVYVAEVAGNYPSLVELRAAVAAAGVPLTLVPDTVNNGDAWLQDQFQMARIGDGPTALPALLHLPRAANSSVTMPGAMNLRSVVDGHFPSDRLGVLKDLWNVPIRLTHATGTEEFSVAETFTTFRQLRAIGRLVNMLTEEVAKLRRGAGVQSRAPSPVSDRDPFALRVSIPRLLAELGASTNQTPELQALLRTMPERVAAVDQTLALIPGSSPQVTLRVDRESRPFQASYADADRHVLVRFFADLAAVHSSRNYGGNIEVTPPVGSASRGITVTGSLHSAALRDLITDRGRNPDTAEVFTEWLDVGHFDEVAAFVKTRESFAVLRASPNIALAILRAARAAQLGQPGGQDGRGRRGRPGGQDGGSEQRMRLVTRLLRGRTWTHQDATTFAATPLRPPALHIRLASRHSPYDLTEFGRPVPREAPPPRGGGTYHDDRAFLVFSSRSGIDGRYAAMVTVDALLETCGETNADIEHLFLGDDQLSQSDQAVVRHWVNPPPQDALNKRLDVVLSRRLPNQRVVPLPVLFDLVDTFRTRSTLAVTPDLVNLLNLGNHVVLPRPYGPRMRPADALELLHPLLHTVGFDCRLTPADLTTRGLDQTWHWTHPGNTVYRAAVGWQPTSFDSGFREMEDANFVAGSLVPAWQSMEPGYRRPPTSWDIQHQRDPWSLHPNAVPEDLRLIATWFRDGFDAFRNHPADYARGDTETAHPAADTFDHDIVPVMDAIRAANPRAFNAEGALTGRDWVRLRIPENTVDLFELWTQVVLEDLGLTVHWADSWYYHTHSGGLHCGTNVLRQATF